MKNSKPKHTPGPWTVNQQTNNVVKGNQFVVCLNEVNQTNAALIAAAPCMLEALEQAEIAIGEVAKQSDVSMPQLADAFHAIAAAILKAKGEQ